MSYILDALRRAENDRRNAHSTPIEQVAIAPLPQDAIPVRRRRLVLAGLLLFICLALVAFAVWHYSRHAVAPKAPLPVLIPAGQIAPKTVAPKTPAASAPATTPVPAAASTTHANPIADAGRLSSLKDLIPPPKPAPRTVIHHPASKTAVAGESPVQSTPAPATPSSPTTASITSGTPATTQHPVEAQPATDNTQALKAMPDSYRANFPQITVQVHVYDSDPAKCWALIDGKHYQEGDSLPQGPKIYKIVPAGIVFDWQGQRVLYPVGS